MVTPAEAETGKERGRGHRICGQLICVLKQQETKFETSVNAGQAGAGEGYANSTRGRQHKFNGHGTGLQSSQAKPATIGAGASHSRSLAASATAFLLTGPISGSIGKRFRRLFLGQVRGDGACCGSTVPRLCPVRGLLFILFYFISHFRILRQLA